MNDFISPDDPLLTAYALGELSPERAAIVEEALKNSPAARQAVEEIRMLAGDLQGALAQEAIDDPVDAGASMDPTISSAAKLPGRVVPFPYVIVGTLAAACLALVIALQDSDAPGAVGTTAADSTELAHHHRAVPADERVLAEAGQRGASVLLVKDAAEAAAIPADVTGADLPAAQGLVVHDSSARDFVRVPNSPLLPVQPAVENTGYVRAPDSLMDDGRRPSRQTVRVEGLVNNADFRQRPPALAAENTVITAAHDLGAPPSEILPIPEDRTDHRLFDELRSKHEIAREIAGRELLTFKIRFKEPSVDVIRGTKFPVMDTGAPFDAAGNDSRFAAAVATLDTILREAAQLGSTEYDQVISWTEGTGEDADARRGEFIDLVKKARALSAE